MSTYALVTGASGGIGKSIAVSLAQRGYDLILVARSEDKLAEIAKTIKQEYEVKVVYKTADLSDPIKVHELIKWIHKLNLPLSILVNNAGFGLWGDFDQLALNEQLQMLRLNIDALVTLSYCLLPLLKKQPQAYILNVSSTAAYQAVPTLALYSASKAAVLSFSRALRYELRKSGVSVSCLCPGATDTGFAQRAGMEKLADLAAKFNMNADEVAAIAVKGLLSKKAEIIPGALNKVSAFMVRLVSKSFVERIGAGLYEK